MDTAEYTLEDAERALLVGAKLELIAAPQALSAGEEYELEELGLIVQTDKPYADLTDDGFFYLEVFNAVRSASVEQAKREIREDIADGTIPATVRSFSELHDYVDANEYGGLADMDVDLAKLSHAAWLQWGIVVQEAVDAWIKSGR